MRTTGRLPGPEAERHSLPSTIRRRDPDQQLLRRSVHSPGTIKHGPDSHSALDKGRPSDLVRAYHHTGADHQHWTNTAPYHFPESSASAQIHNAW